MTALLTYIRRTAHHADTIARRCRMIEQAITTGELNGVPMTNDKIERAVRDIESRVAQLSHELGVNRT